MSGLVPNMSARRFEFNQTHKQGTDDVLPILAGDANDYLYRGLQETVAAIQKFMLAALETPEFCPTMPRLSSQASPLAKMINTLLYRRWLPKCYGTALLSVCAPPSVHDSCM